MLTFANAVDLPSTKAELRELLWLNSLYEAQGGSDESAELMLVALAWHLQQNDLSVSMRIFLSDAIAAIAQAPAKDRPKAAKNHLLLGRRPGRSSKIEAERRELWRAMYMWSVVGDVADADLVEKAEYVAQQLPDEPDPEPFERAYLKHRERLRDICTSQASNSE